MTAYLAMLRKKDVTEEDRRLALETLFRPPTIGVLKEETPPATVLELVKAAISRK